MKGGHNKKSVRVEFVMSEPEAELVKERMAELGITNLSAYLRKMAVDGLKVVGVTQHDIVAVAAALVFCHPHAAVEGGAYGVADVYLQVDAFMHAAETAAIAIGRGDVAGVGHREF